MTTTKIWVDGKLVLDETFDLDTAEEARKTTARHVAVVQAANRRKKPWEIETVEPHLPPGERRYVLTSEDGYLGGALRFLGLVAATALLLLPFFVFDLVVILLVLATIGLVRSYRLRRARQAWRERRFV